MTNFSALLNKQEERRLNYLKKKSKKGTKINLVTKYLENLTHQNTKKPLGWLGLAEKGVVTLG